MVGVDAKTGEFLWRYKEVAKGPAQAFTPIARDGYVYGGALAVGGGLIFALIRLDNAQGRQGDLLGPVFCVGSFFFFVAWIIVLAITQAVSIRADEITYTHISLTGVSEAFVQAVEEAEIERRVRLRQWQEEDEDERWSARREDEPARPHRAPASDAIEEERPPRSTPPPDAFEA